MLELHIGRAQTAYEGQHVESVIIHIEQPIQSCDTLEQAAQCYEESAQKLADALERSLPGGTFDHLAAILLERKASHFRVAFK